MQLSVTFRHMEASEAVRQYAREKVEKIKKYFPDPIFAHVVVGTERGYQHAVDVHIQLHNGLAIKGRETTEDMYSSIDLVMAKIERQVRAFAPWPGAWFEADGERIKLLDAQAGSDAAGKPGEVLDDCLSIAAGNGYLRPSRVQRAGRGAMTVEEFLRGFAIPKGTRLP